MARVIDGIDVSQWNGDANLAGLEFAFARACYGSRVDSRYARHVKRFRAARLIVGAYCFGVGFESPERQAAAFLRYSRGADLLVLDLERDPTRTMTRAQARAFIAYVKRHNPSTPIGLYHSRSGFPSLGQDFNWVAQWRATPPTGIGWTFWQYQGAPLDRDRFNGDLAELHELAGRVP